MFMIQTAEIAKRTFNGIASASAALKGSNDENSSTIIENKGISLLVSSKTLDEQENEATSVFASKPDGPSVIMPSLKNVLNKESGEAVTSISTRMLVAAANPFQSSSPGFQTQGTVVSFQLTDSAGNELNVSNTSEPFVIRVPTNKPASAFISSVKITGFTYHKVNKSLFCLFSLLSLL
jgi:hypothetical protein